MLGECGSPVDYIDWANMRIKVLNEDLFRLDAQPILNRALQADDEFARKASALLDERLAYLQSLEKAVEQRKIELEEFKIRNRLSREAHYPTGGALFLRYAILVFLIVVEGGLNAFFFAQGVSTGLVGGFITAAGFAFVNVGVAFLQGLFTIPFVIHRNPALKIFGATACFLALSLTVLIGLGISHYRDALSVDAENPAQMALVNLQASPLALNDIMSWGLLGMSIIAAISALIDGLSLSDRYPFYGSKHKRYAEAKLEFDNELSELREELKNLKDSSLKQLDEDIAQAQRLLSQQESLIQSKDASMRRLSTALADAEHCMHSLLALFRQENRLHRKGLPPPATFASMPELKELPPPDFDVAADRRALETQQRATDELTARLQAIRASIQTAFNREFDKLKPLGTQLQYAPMPSTAEVAV